MVEQRQSYIDIWWQNKNSIRINNGVDIKSFEIGASQYYSKILYKGCFSNAEDGMQDDSLWDDSEQSGEGTPFSENLSATETPLDEPSD
jgi:hypothetical protein